MKKYLAILLSVLLLMTTVPVGAVVGVSAEAVAASDGPYFAASATAGKAGDTVTVTVSAINNPGIISAKVKVGYDPAVLKLVAYAPGDFSEDDYSWSEITHNPFIINWCNAIDPDSAEELLATLTFEILDGAAYGATPLTLTFNGDEDVFDYDLITVEFGGMDGEVYVLYPVTGIVLDRTEKGLLDGESVSLTATLQAEGKTDPTVVWQSSDTTVATVDENGVVTAIKKGNAVITATAAYGGVSASCKINVFCNHNCGHVVTAPDCVNGGYITFTCVKCGYSYVDDETPALGHSYEAVVTVPTCVDGGYTTYTCSACGDSYVADYTDALGHTEVAVSGKDATCTESGLTEGVKCSVCGEVLVAQEVVEALGHTEVAVSGKDATCTESGLTEGVKCSVCGVILVAQEEIDALGHSYNAVVTVPTCTAEGYTTHTCATCDDSYVADKVPAIGHVYDDDRDADCNECGEIREVVIPGDADGNGRVNNRDLGALQQYLNEWDVSVDTRAVDLNDDGRINNRDLGLLQQYLNEQGVILK